MLQFNEEIKKFKPSLEVDNIEKGMKENNMEDLLDILRYITTNNIDKSKENNISKE